MSSLDACHECGAILQRRSVEQNAKLHALLHEIATQKLWHGQRYDIEDWKRMLTAAWCRASKEDVRLVPALDGAGMDVLYRRTHRMTKAEMSELIEFATAWAIDNGIELREAA